MKARESIKPPGDQTPQRETEKDQILPIQRTTNPQKKTTRRGKEQVCSKQPKAN